MHCCSTSWASIGSLRPHAPSMATHEHSGPLYCGHLLCLTKGWSQTAPASARASSLTRRSPQSAPILGRFSLRSFQPSVVSAFGRFSLRPFRCSAVSVFSRHHGVLVHCDVVAAPVGGGPAGDVAVEAGELVAGSGFEPVVVGAAGFDVAAVRTAAFGVVVAGGEVAPPGAAAGD